VTMHYYHATFFTNRDSILEHGIMRSKPRIWGASVSCYNYMSDSIEEASGWVIVWYQMKMYARITRDYYKQWRISSLSDYELERYVYNLPRINDGIAVFKIDPVDIEVSPRYSSEDPEQIVDYVAKFDIPPANVELVRYISPEEVVEMVLRSYGKHKFPYNE
jgi:hypothetical protein